MSQESPDSIFVVDYIVSLRNRGFFLSYEDYQLLHKWVRACPDIDRLILILDDILPAAFSKCESTSKQPSLKLVAKRVEKSLKALLGSSNFK